MKLSPRARASVIARSSTLRNACDAAGEATDWPRTLGSFAIASSLVRRMRAVSASLARSSTSATESRSSVSASSRWWDVVSGLPAARARSCAPAIAS